MEDLINRYKYELNERISLKKTLYKTNEQIILDNFKYFDLTSSNYCNVDDFIKANERIGVKMKNKEELFKVFNYFDNNKSGLINYRVFAKQILNSYSFNNIYFENIYINKNSNNNNIENFSKKIRTKRDNYNLRNKTSNDNFIFNYNSTTLPLTQEINKKKNNNNYTHMYSNSTFNKQNNFTNNIDKYNNYMQYKNENEIDNEYENEENKNEYNNMNMNINIPIREQPFFDKLISHLLNSNNLPSKSILLFYKNFKINQRNKLYNKISIEDYMDIINNNKINLDIKEIQTLFHYYQNQKDGNFYYEKFFDDILDVYWDNYRQNFADNKIREILDRNRNKTKENNKIKIEDFYNLISITKNNNYNIISVNNYFKNKLNILYPDDYYNEIVKIFMEIKYLTTSNKDSSLNDKDILQLIKFISFGIKSNDDFYTAINYIFNTNKYSSINKINNNNNTHNKNNNSNNKYVKSERKFIHDKFNYNTSLSSLIIIRKYMIEHGVNSFIKMINELNYYSGGGRFIKKYDFAKVLKDFNIIISVNDIEQIFDNFCEDNKKIYLNYYKFIDIILNEFFSKERLNIIKDIFNQIEQYLTHIGRYEINLTTLKDIYNPKNNYYQYDETQALNDFLDNFMLFHHEYYVKKSNKGNNNKDDYNQNFKINCDEFIEFYKMVSFIIEKDEVFENIISNEWKNALLTQNNNINNNNNVINDNNNDNSNNNNNYKDADEYDDYDDYNIKKDNYSSKKNNYIKLKKDLAINPSNNINNINNIQNNKQDYLNTENNNNEIFELPINNSRNRNYSKENFSRINHKRIIRPNSSQKQYPRFNIFNKTFDLSSQQKPIYNNNYNSNNIINNKSPLEILTMKLKMRGLRGLMNLHKQFLFTCNDLSSISISNFAAVLKNQKIYFENNEIKQIFLKFRKENTKFLDFSKFIREFKKPLNEKRLEAVEDAFSKLDVDSNDNIFIETIKRKYNPKGDPLYLNGKKNEEEVSTEFLDCFELNYNLLTAVDNQNVTNVVSFEEFANFYEYVSFLYENDDDFIKLVNDSWDE